MSESEEKSEIKYTQEEEDLIEDCLEYFLANNMRANVNPDEWKTVKKAITYSHRKGEIIRKPATHKIMRSIRRKNGEDVEEPEDIQKRLAAERIIIRSSNRRATLLKDRADAEKRLKEAESTYEDFENKIGLADLRRKGASDREIVALEKAKKAEDEVSVLREEMQQIKELLKGQIQEKKNMANMEETLEELEKEEEAEIIPEVPEPTPEPEAPKVDPPSEEPEAEEPEEKTIEDLIEELKE